ncbi:MAG TPA: SDR family NAD(P)-dependent oxidoreductase [Thermoanaerobaculia bacterium]|nr:SDR family NAD(P)-dependent oxidoreductase [Thermoanaerobaculia bacterium]
MSAGRVAVITGASSGIGAAAARALAGAGFEVVLGARRVERIEALARELGGRAALLDVADTESVRRFCAPLSEVALLVNNAGGALGLERVAEADEDHWRTMIETNFLGVMRMTRELLPRLIASGDGHVLTVGSIAGFETYAGGGGYTAAKHAARAFSRCLRLELLGSPVRVTEVAPGLVETEFSLVRFDGDAERAAGVYRGMTPLTAEDVAECIVWAATRPPHVNIDEIVVRPRDQATAHHVHRATA